MLLVLLFLLRLRANRKLPYSLVAYESPFYVCMCFLTAVCSSYFLFDGREIKPRAKKRFKTTLCCPFSLFCCARKKDIAWERYHSNCNIILDFVLFLRSRFVKVCLVRMLTHRLHHEQK